MAPQSNIFESYYVNQAGAGLPVYRGSTVMRGHGIGSFLAGLFRSVFPVLKSAGRAVLTQAANAGANVLHDVVSGQTPLRDSLKRRVEDAGQQLRTKLDAKVARMQDGSGYKRRTKPTKSHSRVARRTVQNRRSKKPIFKNDIFSR